MTDETVENEIVNDATDVGVTTADTAAPAEPKTGEGPGDDYTGPRGTINHVTAPRGVENACTSPRGTPGLGVAEKPSLADGEVLPPTPEQPVGTFEPEQAEHHAEHHDEQHGDNGGEQHHD